MSDSTADESGSLCGRSGHRSRKSGYSNIISGMNIHQLQRLFQTAGDRDAEHRAQLVWGRGEDEDFQQVKNTEAAGLAQALVGLRICAGTKAGLRAEVPTREHRWHNASLHEQPSITQFFSQNRCYGGGRGLAFRPGFGFGLLFVLLVAGLDSALHVSPVTL